MAKPQYGPKHQRARKLALENFVDGTPCAFCHKPMHIWQKLDLDHVVPVALGGEDGPTRLVHHRCNHRAGSRLGGVMAHRRLPRGRRKGPGKKRVPVW